MTSPATNPRPPEPAAPEMMLTDEVCQLARICPSTLMRLVMAGEAPNPVRIGRSVRWPRRRVLEWLGLCDTG